MQISVSSTAHTYIVLDIRLAPVEKKNSTSFIVPVLAAEMQGGETAAVLDVEIGLERTGQSAPGLSGEQLPSPCRERSQSD